MCCEILSLEGVSFEWVSLEGVSSKGVSRKNVFTVFSTTLRGCVSTTLRGCVRTFDSLDTTHQPRLTLQNTASPQDDLRSTE